MITTPPLPEHNEPVTAAQLVAHADLEARARTLAIRSEPPAGFSALSAPEAKVVEAVRHRINARHQELDAAAHDLRVALSDLPDHDGGSLEALPATVRDAIMAVFRTHAATIRQRVGAEQVNRAELAAFRHKHGLLERSAVYPASKPQHFSELAMLGFAEAVANAFMYLSATTAGYLGALLTSLSVAAVVVGVATFAGLVPLRALYLHDLPPELPNRRRNARLWAVPTLGGCTALIGFINFYAAHYRELGIISPDGFSEVEVLHHLMAQPTELSLASFGLLIFGVLCAGLAIYKAYTSTDRYFGYEKVDRRHVTAREDCDDLQATIQGALDSVRQIHLDGPLDRTIAVRSLIDDLRKRNAARLIAIARTRRLDATDIAAAAAAIAAFRDLNRSIRSDRVVPLAFRSAPDLAAVVPAIEPDDLGARIDQAYQRQVEHLGRLLQQLAVETERITAAKNRTSDAMAVIANATIPEDELPALSNLQTLFELDHDRSRTPAALAAA